MEIDLEIRERIESMVERHHQQIRNYLASLPSRTPEQDKEIHLRELRMVAFMQRWVNTFMSFSKTERHLIICMVNETFTTVEKSLEEMKARGSKGAECPECGQWTEEGPGCRCPDCQEK
jgi:hypothetical protein